MAGPRVGAERGVAGGGVGGASEMTSMRRGSAPGRRGSNPRSGTLSALAAANTGPHNVGGSVGGGTALGGGADLGQSPGNGLRDVPRVFVDLQARRIVVDTAAAASVARLEDTVRASGHLPATLGAMRDKVRTQERVARQRLAETREAVRSEGYPEADDDVEYLLEDASGLSRSTYAQIKGALLERLRIVREVANTCWDAMDELLQRQANLRPMSLSDVEAHRRYVIGRFLRARQEIINKYQSYLRNLKWLELASSRQRRGCLTAKQNNILRVWLFSNFQNPYPEHPDKLDLATRTGLTLTQINNWFINARVRVWKPTVELMTGERMKRETGAELATESSDRRGSGRRSGLNPTTGGPGFGGVKPEGADDLLPSFGDLPPGRNALPPAPGVRGQPAHGPAQGNFHMAPMQRASSGGVGGGGGGGLLDSPAGTRRRNSGYAGAGISKPAHRGASRGPGLGGGTVRDGPRKDDRTKNVFPSDVQGNLPILSPPKGQYSGGAHGGSQTGQAFRAANSGGPGGLGGYYAGGGGGAPNGHAPISHLGAGPHQMQMQGQQPGPHQQQQQQQPHQPQQHQPPQQHQQQQAFQGQYQSGGPFVFPRGGSGQPGSDTGYYGQQGRDTQSRSYGAPPQNMQYQSVPQQEPYFSMGAGGGSSDGRGGQHPTGNQIISAPSKYQTWGQQPHGQQQPQQPHHNQQFQMQMRQAPGQTSYGHDGASSGATGAPGGSGGQQHMPPEDGGNQWVNSLPPWGSTNLDFSEQ